MTGWVTWHTIRSLNGHWCPAAKQATMTPWRSLGVARGSSGVAVTS
jgi:hypothetical protein